MKKTLRKSFQMVFKLIKITSGLKIIHICGTCLFFLGLLPTNLCRKKIFFLIENDYLVFEKSDGIRVIFIFFEKRIHLLDRNFFLIEIKKNLNQSGKNEHNLSVVLDGELCFNLINDIYEFLIYDCVYSFKDWRILSWDLKGRINGAKYTMNRFKLCDDFKIRIKMKTIFKPNEVYKLFFRNTKNILSSDSVYVDYQNNTNTMCNRSDGVVFTPSKFFYIIRFSFLVFKWKSRNKNSVDFKIQTHIQSGVHFTDVFKKTMLYFKIKKKNTYLKFKNARSINYHLTVKTSYEKKHIGKISEYIFDKKDSNWKFVKIRKDKIVPNSFKTMMTGLEIISKNMSRTELIDNLLKINLRIKRGK